LRGRLTLLVLLVAALGGAPSARAADDAGEGTPVPRATCGPGSTPETGMQGRMTPAEYAAGRSPTGLTCNMKLLGHIGATGGFRVHRYVDAAGHECAYYDTTRLFPTEYLLGGKSAVAVLDMKDPAHPVETARLLTPAMLTPHESLSINVKRGLLAADMGNPFTHPGFFDIYDISGDCRHPVLKSSLPIGVLGHEGSFAPDGNTFYVTSIAGLITALDVTNPTLPVPLWTTINYRPHGINVSDDGNRLYVADIANADAHAGLTILDVSEVQARKPNPQVRLVSKLSWPVVSIPQTAIPVTIGGHKYVVEIDEFARYGWTQYNPEEPVGGARIIDIGDDAKPRVVSTIRLAANLPANRAAISGDAGATNNLGGYTGHYCAVPQRAEPGIVACTFNLSGLRVFDIRDALHPREIAYFNKMPPTETASAMSAPAFVPERGEIWYADGTSGFYALRVTNNLWPFPAVQAATARPPAKITAPATDVLPASGPTVPLIVPILVVGVALVARRYALTTSAMMTDSSAG
jgi:hypothetical protein